MHDKMCQAFGSQFTDESMGEDVAERTEISTVLYFLQYDVPLAYTPPQKKLFRMYKGTSNLCWNVENIKAHFTMHSKLVKELENFGYIQYVYNNAKNFKDEWWNFSYTGSSHVMATNLIPNLCC